MSVVRGWEVQGVKVPMPFERVLKILVSPEVGNSEHTTILFSIISPGSTTGLHRHEESEECMYVVSGRGCYKVAGKEISFEPDSILIAKKGEEHEIRNLSDETMKLVAIFAPPLKPSGYIEEALRKRLASLKK
ncbi:cupin domain-containing protein [Candidatus Bathyarchaeota archaeon]|nr:cupin domain-containing protein [Candidatus Bathyarchaeota archaeon]MBS7627409.1 cupin domain-containing protein [Candidatus Bathyarchaeota archaeon]